MSDEEVSGGEQVMRKKEVSSEEVTRNLSDEVGDDEVNAW